MKYPKLGSRTYLATRMKRWLWDVGYKRCARCKVWQSGLSRSLRCRACSSELANARYVERKAERDAKRLLGPPVVSKHDDWLGKGNEYFAGQVKAAADYYTNPKILEHMSRLAGVRL